MITDFELHIPSSQMVTCHELPDGSICGRVYDMVSGAVIGDIKPWYMPQGVRFSPNGFKVSFFGDGALYIYDLKDQTIDCVFHHPNLDASFCEWSPSGNELVFSAYPVNDKRHPPDIYTHALDTRTHIQLTDSEYVDRFPQWSPSGQYIVFQRQSLTEAGLPKHIQVIDTRTGESYDYSPNPHASYKFGRRCWVSNSDYLLALEYANAKTELVMIDVKERKLIRKIDSSDALGVVMFSDRAELVAVHQNELEILSSSDFKSNAHIPLPDGVRVSQRITGPQVVAGDDRVIYFTGSDNSIYRWTEADGFAIVIHEDNPKINFQHEEYTFRSYDGRMIPAHRLIPPNPKPVAIIYVFGGPTDPISLNDKILLQLVSEGYEVICPAYRGKSGYGTEHQDANIGEYGHGDVLDVIECARDWGERTDSQRPVAIIGFSYGGFLTYLAMARRDSPWACGISLWGATSIDYMGLHVPRAYPDDQIKKQMAQFERSPIQQASCISAPLLILHGGLDTTSTDDDVQLIQKRVEASGTLCRVVIYEDDGHGLKRHRGQMFEEIFRFLDKYGDGDLEL